ncbi:helix-turn-helix transcriptional regulator [Streptomyces caniferus]|uniref:helix-turn-helix domain-containing protein n=1 Tax=Streptomyces caniferus TaxID=285557 RepID=UPI002E2CA980|nr:helix-turn-helix transcriptional regulator [Streptomyces caniferus]
MSVSSAPLSSEQDARRKIARQLGQLRRDAGLTGYELASRCGWSQSKVSRIEAGRTRPSDRDLAEWCQACDRPEDAADLIEAARTADSMYREWKQIFRHGVSAGQKNVDLYQAANRIRYYVSNMVPGLLQTREYAEALLSTIADFTKVPNDAPRAARARIERSKVLYDRSKTFSFVLEEAVLYHRYGSVDVMLDQLDRLRMAASLRNVSLGIIPMPSVRNMWTLEGFVFFGDSRVNVETLTAWIAITRPSELSMYAEAFDELHRMAVYGADARHLIAKAEEAHTTRSA